MFGNVIYYSIAGFPLIMYMGATTFLLLIFTASISILNVRGFRKIGLRWHHRMAYVTIAFAAVHALLAVISYI